MKEHIDQLTHLAEVLYSDFKGLYTVSRSQAKILQDIIDEMQEELDEIANELHRPE